MDLNTIGFNFNIIDKAHILKENRQRIRKSHAEADKENARPTDNNTSIANRDKGRVVDVSF